MNDLVPRLSERLFAEPDTNVFAVLDGARIGRPLQLQLHALKPEHACLYRGELKPDLAECAPYLVRLEKDGAFANWVLGEGWGKSWGIFALSPADLVTMRKHFRTFLMIKHPEGKQVYFRYYDPRVLRLYLPTCNAQETQAVFGPVKWYLCEDEKPEIALSFQTEQGLAKTDATTLV